MTLRTAPQLATLLATSAAAAVVVYRFLQLAIAALQFPYPLDYGEGFVLDVALRLARFENIYPSDLRSPPWLVSNYPPVYYLARAVFLWTGEPALWQGRVICQLSAVGTALLIGLVLHRFTGNRAAAALGGLTFLAIPFVALWSQIDRVDVLALLLSWLALRALMGPRDGRHLAFAVLCLVASSYTRQTGAIPGVVAAYVWLWHQGRHRHANVLLASVGLLGLLIALALQAATDGGFLFHVLTATASPLSMEQLRNLGRRPLVLIPGLLVVAAGASLAGVRYRPPGWALVTAYVLASAVMSLTVAKVGSAQNYFLDLSAACALAAGASVHWLRTRPVILTGCALLLVPQMIWMGFQTWPYAPIQSRLGQEANYRQLESLVRATPGPVVADEASALVIVTGHDIDFHPFPMSQLADAGLWDPAPFIERLERHHYQVILLRMSIAQPRPIGAYWTPRLAEALLRHYDRTEAFQVDRGSAIVVYRPRAAAGTATAGF